SSRRPGWPSTAALIVYAVCFSYAYLYVETGTGALLLFGAVQGTMVVAALRDGEKPSRLGLMGMAAASAGLILLVLPGISAPPLGAAAFMLMAGIGWGIYSHAGRGQPNPYFATATNFVRAAPFGVVILTVAVIFVAVPTFKGVLLAATSGALTSGLGYVIWYAALRHHTSTSAAAVQLSAPLLAIAGGIVVLGEPLTMRLLVGGVLIIGGIVLSLLKPTADPRR
ncbi:MAG: DMT family transporter, partial [Myxococcota bacterium]